MHTDTPARDVASSRKRGSRKRGRAPKLSLQRRDPAAKLSSENPVKGCAAGGVHAGVRGTRDRGRAGVGNGNCAAHGSANGSVNEDVSDSSMSDDDGRPGPSFRTFSRHEAGRRAFGIGKSASSGTGTRKVYGNVRAEGHEVGRTLGGAAPVQSRRDGGRKESTMATSKSEGHLSTSKKGAGRFPRALRASDDQETGQAAPRRKRDFYIPPPGGKQPAVKTTAFIELETQLAFLRGSPVERKALRERVSRHVSNVSKHRNRLQNEHGEGYDSSSVESNGSGSSLTFYGQEDEEGVYHERWKPWRFVDVGEWTAAAKAQGAKERERAQALHAKEVLGRKTAIDEEHRKQMMERLAFLEDGERKARDRKTRRKQQKAMMVLTTFALALSEWMTSFEKKRDARRLALKREKAACRLQKAWRSYRIRKTWAEVRGAGPAVQKFVFRMRLRGAIAREVVARRHRGQAADLITTVLRAGTRSLFRTRISYYREKIITCQKFINSLREVTKARRKALMLKWTRQVAKLDEKRFITYSAHLRDMYNFDPTEVECFLKEMRKLAANAQSVTIKTRARPKTPTTLTGKTLQARKPRLPGEKDGNEPARERQNESPASKGKGRPGLEESDDRKSASPQRVRKQGVTPTSEGQAQKTRTAPAPKPAKAKLAPGWQKRVVQVKMDVEAQANLMTKRGVKHKEISRELRSVLINDLLSHARWVHKDWFWNNVRAAGEKKRQAAIVNLLDIRTALQAPSESQSAEEDVLEAKIKSINTKNSLDLPADGQQGLHLMNMISNDILTRCIILGERMEGCVAADEAGSGTLSPVELHEIFVANRHPAQHEAVAAMEVKAELKAWAKARGLTLPSAKRVSSRTASYHLQRTESKHSQANKVQQVPYFDFMSVVKAGILSDICVPEGQRQAVEASESATATSKTSPVQR